MPDTLIDHIKAEAPVYLTWSLLPSPHLLEQCARSDFGGVVLDMQHGLITEADAREMISAAYLADKPVLVRIPLGRFDLASRVLDWGARGVVAPMINDPDLARDFVDTMKYPPLGQRSWGAVRAHQLQEDTRDGTTFLKDNNAETAAFAMIETRDALDNLEGILAVPGLDGVLVEPSDLSISLSDGAWVDSSSSELDVPLSRIASVCAERDLIAAIYAKNPTEALRFKEFGFQCIAVGADVAYVDLGLSSIFQTLIS